MNRQPHRSTRRQIGSATLVMGLILLVGASILTMSATRTSVMEQRIANNESRAMEAEQAARAGLDFAAAWLSGNLWSAGTVVVTAPDVDSMTGDTYETQLNLDDSGGAICVTAQSTARLDPSVTATQHECFLQRGLFDPRSGSGMPPPLVLAGCLAAPIASVELLVTGPGSVAATSGTAATASCLTAGSMSVSLWRDSNHNGQLDISEVGTSTSLQRSRFASCFEPGCAWRHYFAITLAEAKRLAAVAGHRYASGLPCGPPTTPGIYLIEQSGSIGVSDFTGRCVGTEGIDNATIGTPSQPVLLIVPKERGCPAFRPGVTIHGIVYYESATACAGIGWGGARVYGSVIWDGDAGPPGTGAQFIESHYGVGGKLNAAFKTVLDSVRVPGTWRDWN